ncbi:hypothetical protein ACIRPX_29335 [Streptomyces sp. NPDC101225]|uniref:hypothetical protein n=1 Tax=Streptomyces sp. NPDC101225 TaxID=3366135 RepID=UPI00381D1013
MQVRRGSTRISYSPPRLPATPTSGINKFVSDLALPAAVQLVDFDGKGSQAAEGDYADLFKRMFAFYGDGVDEANALFKRLVALCRRRSSVIRHVGVNVRSRLHG